MDTNDKAIVKVTKQQITSDVVNLAKQIAPLATMYGLKPEQATIAMLTGWELGLGMMAALNYVDVIPVKGGGFRPSLRAQAMLALINSSGVLDAVDVTDHADDKGPSGCSVYMRRIIGRTTVEHTESFMREDALRAGLLGKSNWQNYPAAMYYNRALSGAARRICPDVIMGLYTPEEIALEGEWTESPDGAIVGFSPPLKQEPERPSTQIKSSFRPYPPAELRVKLVSIIVKQSQMEKEAFALPEQCDLVSEKLTECFSPDDDAAEKAFTVLCWLTDPDSRLKMAESHALLNWLIKPGTDTFELHEHAPAEARAVLAMVYETLQQETDAAREVFLRDSDPNPPEREGGKQDFSDAIAVADAEMEKRRND